MIKFAGTKVPDWLQKVTGAEMRFACIAIITEKNGVYRVRPLFPTKYVYVLIPDPDCKEGFVVDGRGDQVLTDGRALLWPWKLTRSVTFVKTQPTTFVNMFNYKGE